MMPIIDVGFSISTISAAIGFYGFCLFVYCWWLKKEASIVYIYVTFLLLGLGIEHAVEAYVKYRYMNFGEDTFRFTFWWPLRLVIVTGSMFFLVGELTKRAFFHKGKGIEPDE
jgi:hypothetical protein